MAEVLEIWTDGACSKNGTPQARAGVGVHVGDGDSRNISRPLDLAGEPTNNKAELRAIDLALDIVQQRVEERANERALLEAAGEEKQPPLHVIINTDSTYSLLSLTEWMEKRIPAKNTALLLHIHQKIQALKNVCEFELVKVPAHTGQNDGNAKADKLAKDAVHPPKRKRVTFKATKGKKSKVKKT